MIEAPTEGPRPGARRSALKHVAKAKTPTMLRHGENDSDVPIAETEQYYIALKDAGVETILVRYRREGHGLREPKHIVDSRDRSIHWCRKHFPRSAPPAPQGRPFDGGGESPARPDHFEEHRDGLRLD